MNEAQAVFQDTIETVHFLGNKVNENTLKYIGIAVAIFLIFLFLRNIFTKCILSFLLKLSGKGKTEIGTKIIEAFQGPIRAIFIVFGIYFAIIFLGKAFTYNLLREPFLNHMFKSLNIIFISWGLYNLTGEQSLLYEELSEKFNFKLDKIIFPFLSRILRIVIIGLTICVVLGEWGYNVNGFVAGLGIGGLAFALAAQETLANIFGGLVIILDKPFSIGDYIKTPNVEGIVEDINFRSTRIRALDKGLVTEPNSIIAKSTITNWTKRDIRRINFTIGLTYGTTKEEIQKCINKIKDMLVENENIIEEGIIVSFNNFGASSLDILINCFANTADFASFMNIREDINFKIIDILDQEGVSIAFPSTSLYFETPLIRK